MEKSDEEKILNFIEEEVEVSAGKITAVLGINWYKVERILAELVSKDRIDFEQKPRGNYYKIKEKE